MSAPALTVRCGSCKNVINVPANLLERLLEVKRFNCPHCKEGQQINSDVLTKYSGRPFIEQAQGKQRVLLQQPNGSSIRRPIHESRSAWQSQYDRTNGVDDDAGGAREDEAREEDDHEAGEIFADYKPLKLPYGRPHPDAAVETASLAAVEPPDITYELHIHDLVESGKLSRLQLESIVYACQRHEQLLPSGDRCGFFIGDGAGVGKGRTIAGLILENWRCGRCRHLWISVGSDLRVDARRDLNDADGSDIDIHALNKLQYGQLDSDKLGVRAGVIFLSYSSLISGCENGSKRIDQLTEWCGKHFGGLIIFDECHKAKNLVPESGAKPTKVGRMVLELQQSLPQARVVYCSATGASEPRNMGYMERLGLWGEQHPAFPTFADFLEVIGSRGVGALEMVAMDMKARGMYVCRTLSFAGAEFEVVESELEEPLRTQYSAAARMWSQIRREFLYAIEQASGGEEDAPKKGNMLWRFFWAAQQRFFRHLCMAAKVPNLVRMAQRALEEDKCCVIGLQSTGEARTQDVVAEKGEELDDFVSGPRELLLKLVEDHYPLPPDPDEEPAAIEANGKSGPAGKAAAGKGRRRKVADGPETSKGTKRARSRPEQQNGTDLAPVDGVAETNGEHDEAWERMHGSGAAGTSGKSQAEGLQQTAQGRLRLAEMRDALKRAQQRKAQVKTCAAGLDLPHNPLDMLIDLLGGPEKVAEMTGRKGRLIRIKRDQEASSEKLGVKWEARNASGVGPGATLEMINVHERKLFLDGEKLIAIISEAASAGISLHADKRAKNQRRRVHLTLELPWSADKAIQQFGRSHRANQAHGPQYRLLFTPLGGERRFASSVARRLESLGALTQGDRKAGPSLSAFNYESVWGQRALKRIFRVIMGDEITPIDIPACAPRRNGQSAMSESKFLGKARAQLLGVGLIRPAEDAIHVNMYLSQENGAPVGVGKISDADKQDVGRFLNRLLGLDPEWQACLFDFFQAMLEHVVAEAKRDGRYQDGIVDVKATSVTLKDQPKVVRMDEATKAPTLLCTIVTDRGVSWAQALEMLDDPEKMSVDQNGVIDLEAATPAEPPAIRAQNGQGFYRSINPVPPANRHAIVLALPQETKQGVSWTIVRPNTGRQLRPVPTEQLLTRYRRANDSVAHQMWQAAYDDANKFGLGHRLRELHLLSGLVLPIWPQLVQILEQQSRAHERRLNVVRLETTGPSKRRLVGVLLPPRSVKTLMTSLGADSLTEDEDQVIPLDD